MDSLLGITFSDWWSLLRENEYAISRRYWRRALTLSVVSVANSAYKRRERLIIRNVYRNVDILTPIFILGHWRSGTTLLHNLMALDKQFAYPSLFQITNPHSFLTREASVLRRANSVKPKKRPMDNMLVTAFSPGEDEFATSAMCQKSPLVGWTFPRREALYDRFLTFREVDEQDLRKWKDSFISFLRRLTWKYNRPLLIKSPAHTARIRMMLELFPDARFIHVSRDPYTVYKSTVHLYKTAVPQSYLQVPPEGNRQNGILQRYVTMHEVYFEERDLIPGKNLAEIRFEDLEKDKVGMVKKLYEQLGISGWERLKPKLEEYVDSIANYKKNKYAPLSESERETVAKNWKRCFEEWGYPL